VIREIDAQSARESGCFLGVLLGNHRDFARLSAGALPFA
jgi:hypothetical protein